MNSVIITLNLTSFLSLFGISRATTYFRENDIPELIYLNTSVDPCENFYEFTCGNFEKTHSLSSTSNILDHFTLLEDDLIKIGNEILSSGTNKNDPIAVKKAKAAYRACVNVDSYNRVLAPEMITVKECGGMPLLSSSVEATEFSWNEIGDLVGKYGVPLILMYTAGQISQNESMIAISTDSLSNPSLLRPQFTKSYDFVLEETFQAEAKRRLIRSTTPAPFDVFLQTLSKKLLEHNNSTKSDEEMLADLNDMATFMRQLYAGGIVDGEVLPLSSQVSVEQLQEWTNKQFAGELINWIDYLNRVFQMSGIEITKDTQIYQQNIQKIYGVLNLVKQTDPKIVKNFALLRVFLFQAPDSDNITRKAFEEYYTSKGYQLYSRPEYCTRKILDVVDTASLSYALTYSYQKYYYNINKLNQAAELVQNILKTFADTVNDSDWMDNQSRDAALQKIRNILVLLGYPDFVDDLTSIDKFYENFRVCEWDNYGNARNIRAFKQAYQFTQLQPNRLFWGKSTFDVNAYYNRPNNKMVIPISMLNPVFFYGDKTILDYSRLGSIVGHEITHGFDVNGKNYDENGLLDSWWTEETMDTFNEATTCFKNQYSQYYISELQTYINGSYSVNENLADNGGVRQAYKTFKQIVDKEKLTGDGNYSLDQLFFIGYGTMWCGIESNYALNVLVSTPNGYSPKKYRVIGSLSNMKEFSDAFNCPLGSNMNPEIKCVLW